MLSPSRYAYPLTAALVAAAMAGVVSKDATADASPTQCVGSPFAFSEIASHIDANENAPENGRLEVFLTAMGARTVIDCLDHDHALDGQTLEVSQAARLVFDIRRITGGVRGTTQTTFGVPDGNGKAVLITSFKSPTRGTGECDAAGVCTLNVEVRASTRDGGQVTMREVLTLDTNTGKVTSLGCTDWGYRAGS